MKILIAVALLVTSVSSFAEVCKTSDYNFDISEDTISFSEADGEMIGLRITLVKTVSGGIELRQFVAGMVSDTVSDSPISEELGSTIAKISMVGTEGNSEIIGMAYAKSFDKNGKLVTRFMLSEDGYFRCL